MTELDYKASDIDHMRQWQMRDIDAGEVNALMESEIRAFEAIKDHLSPVENDSPEFLEFRADIINGLTQTFKKPQEIVAAPSPDQIKILETVLFTGGTVNWIDESVAVKPYLTDYLQEHPTDHLLRSYDFYKAVLNHIQPDTIEGIPTLFGENNKHDARRSVAGRLVIAQLAERPLIQSTEQDVTDDVDRFRQEGVILAGAVDQFVDFGDGETITKYFAKLRAVENQPVMNRLVADESPYTVSVILRDGSMRTERLDDEAAGSIRIIYRSKQPIEVADALLETEDGSVGKVMAGYESFKHVPYMPVWALDSSFANTPCTAELEVNTSGYQLEVYSGFKDK